MITTDNLDDAALDALQRLCDNATDPPWMAEYVYHLKRGCRCLSCHEDEPYGKAIHELDGLGEDSSPVLSESDADFVAAARTAVPALIAEVRRLRAKLARCQPVVDAGEVWRKSDHLDDEAYDRLVLAIDALGEADHANR